jgi:hypothetical protein
MHKVWAIGIATFYSIYVEVCCSYAFSIFTNLKPQGEVALLWKKNSCQLGKIKRLFWYHNRIYEIPITWTNVDYWSYAEWRDSNL